MLSCDQSVSARHGIHRYARTNGFLERTMRFFHTRIQNCLQNKPTPMV